MRNMLGISTIRKPRSGQKQVVHVQYAANSFKFEGWLPKRLLLV